MLIERNMPSKKPILGEDFINFDIIKDYIEYCPESGIFYKIKPYQGFGKLGPIKNVHAKGYIRITFMLRRILAHRLAWWWVYGKLPSKFIDHINGDGFDNRISNLRDCNASENSRNAKSHRSGKLIGIQARYGNYYVGWHYKSVRMHVAIYKCAYQAEMAHTMFDNGEIVNNKIKFDFIKKIDRRQYAE